jgi:hypothetical protein
MTPIIYTLARQPSHGDATIGHLSGPSLTSIYTLEDVVREPLTGCPVDQPALDAWVAGWKVFGKTAIPFGRYRLAWTYSNRFGRSTLQLLGVPGFGGIRIHGGNTDEDTEGCILLGLALSGDTIAGGTSRPAVAKFEALVCPHLEDGTPVYIDIVRAA